MQEPDIKLDIFFVYSADDKEVAKMMTIYLKKEKSSVQIVTLDEITTKENSWHHDVFQVMMSSAK